MLLSRDCRDFALTNGDYKPIVAHGGRWESEVLGLELAMEAGRIRFFHGTAPLPEAEELIERLGSMVDDVVQREAALALRLEQERERAEGADSARKARTARRRRRTARGAPRSAAARAGR